MGPGVADRVEAVVLLDEAPAGLAPHRDVAPLLLDQAHRPEDPGAQEVTRAGGDGVDGPHGQPGPTEPHEAAHAHLGGVGGLDARVQRRLEVTGGEGIDPRGRTRLRRLGRSR